MLPAFGVAGQSISYDGTDDLINLDAHSATFGALQTGSISAWFKTSVGAPSPTVFSVSNTSVASGDSRLCIEGGEVSFRVRDNALGLLVRVDTVATYADNAWHHAVFAVDASGNTLYVDGVAVSVTYVAGSAASTEFLGDISGVNSVKIGASRDSGGVELLFTGDIGAVYIHSVALTAQEVGAMYASDGAWYPRTGLVSRWTMVNNGVSTGQAHAMNAVI